MVKESKSELYKKIQADYHKNLKELESVLASLHKELHQVEQGMKHEEKKIYGISKFASLKTKKSQLDGEIFRVKKEIRILNKERIKKVKKLKKA